MKSALILALIGLALAAPTHADSVKVENAWTRATAPGQRVAGGFMDLTADADMALVGGGSAVSNEFELHTMKVENGVMTMRQVREIALPKGQTIQLKPGGLHIMFIGLKKQLKEGDVAPVELIVRSADGREQTLRVDLPVHRGSTPTHRH